MFDPHRTNPGCPQQSLAIDQTLFMNDTKNSQLLQPMRIGAWELPNRFIMAPLTRCRASAGRVPNAMMAEYYAQRASAGMILTEATSVTPMGVGYPDTPGVWSGRTSRRLEDRHPRRCTKPADGILLQLWHVGRMSRSDLSGRRIAGGPEGNLRRPATSARSCAEGAFVTPRALDSAEIPGHCRGLSAAVRRTGAAGRLRRRRDSWRQRLPARPIPPGRPNKRTDEYGGPIENRARLMLEVGRRRSSACGARTGWACTWRLAAMPTRARATPIPPPHSDTWRGNRAGGGLAFLWPARLWAKPASVRSSRRRSAAATSPTRQLTLGKRPRSAPRRQARPTQWPGEGFFLSPIPTLPERFAEGAAPNEPKLAAFYGGGPGRLHGLSRDSRRRYREAALSQDLARLPQLGAENGYFRGVWLRKWLRSR